MNNMIKNISNDMKTLINNNSDTAYLELIYDRYKSKDYLDRDKFINIKDIDDAIRLAETIHRVADSGKLKREHIGDEIYDEKIIDYSGSLDIYLNYKINGMDDRADIFIKTVKRIKRNHYIVSILNTIIDNDNIRPYLDYVNDEFLTKCGDMINNDYDVSVLIDCNEDSIKSNTERLLFFSDLFKENKISKFMYDKFIERSNNLNKEDTIYLSKLYVNILNDLMVNNGKIYAQFISNNDCSEFIKILYGNNDLYEEQIEVIAKIAIHNLPSDVFKKCNSCKEFKFLFDLYDPQKKYYISKDPSYKQQFIDIIQKIKVEDIDNSSDEYFNNLEKSNTIHARFKLFKNDYDLLPNINLSYNIIDIIYNIQNKISTIAYNEHFKFLEDMEGNIPRNKIRGIEGLVAYLKYNRSCEW